MSLPLLRLYPWPGLETEREGLYLAHRLHTLGTADRPWVYANFLSSLDGRIALDDSETGASYIPKLLKSASDFALFMELHAQADCLITHGGYLRALGAGRLGNILQIRDPALIEWRLSQGLAPQPAVVIASATLEFPLHDSLKAHDQAVYIATGQRADSDRIRNWQDQGYPVLITGNDRWVDGARLIPELGRLGFASIYLIAGPKMLDTMVRNRLLARMYLTLTHQFIGGQSFHPLLSGPVLGESGCLQLETAYFEPGQPSGAGQFFLRFDLNRV